MLDTIITWDQNITTLVSSLLPHSPFFDKIFFFLSLEGLTIVVWITLFVVFSYRKLLINRLSQFLIAFSISFSATSILVNVILKNVFMRDRPWVAQQLSDITCPNNFSFPSGHASGAFVGAIIFAYFDRKRSWLYYGIATLISLSRVYLVCHYMLDIVVGAFIGYFVGWLTIWILTRRKII